MPELPLVTCLSELTAEAMAAILKLHFGTDDVAIDSDGEDFQSQLVVNMNQYYTSGTKLFTS